jgi:hypothetical protein
MGFFRKSQPPKPDPVNFMPVEIQHEPIAILFDKSIEASAKARNFKKIFIIEGRVEKRIQSILDTTIQVSCSFVSHQRSAIEEINTASSIQEMLAIQLSHMTGETPPRKGITLCPGCLARAIILCEENLIALKDLQDAIKEYTDD